MASDAGSQCSWVTILRSSPLRSRKERAAQGWGSDRHRRTSPGSTARHLTRNVVAQITSKHTCSACSNSRSLLQPLPLTLKRCSNSMRAAVESCLNHHLRRLKIWCSMYAVTSARHLRLLRSVPPKARDRASHLTGAPRHLRRDLKRRTRESCSAMSSDWAVPGRSEFRMWHS